MPFLQCIWHCYKNPYGCLSTPFKSLNLSKIYVWCLSRDRKLIHIKLFLTNLSHIAWNRPSHWSCIIKLNSLFTTNRYNILTSETFVIHFWNGTKNIVIEKIFCQNLSLYLTAIKLRYIKNQSIYINLVSFFLRCCLHTRCQNGECKNVWKETCSES